MARIAVIQMVSSAKLEENLSRTSTLLQAAQTDGAELCLLPENFPLMGIQEQDKLTIQEPAGEGPIQQFLESQAIQLNIWIIAGTIPLQASRPDRIRAAQLVYTPTGKCIARYDKIHLFDVCIENEGEENYKESNTIEPGENVIVVNTPLGNIGLSTCYDLRFPELYRAMHAKQVHIITVPSAFTYTTGKAHWESLLRARAVENQCYVLAANQGGEHSNQRKTWGHSMIINPWGEILATVGQGCGIAIADINLDTLEQLRKNFPNLAHRKLQYTFKP